VARAFGVSPGPALPGLCPPENPRLLCGRQDRRRVPTKSLL
jgi:hypothetical protein